jgi:hypothetical protein
LQNDLRAGKVTAPIGRVILPPEKWFCKFGRGVESLPGDFSVGKMTSPMSKAISPPEK